MLAKVQAKISRANRADGGCAGSKLWPRVVSSLTRTESSSHNASPFALLLAEPFRTRTRDLVQHSFVEALAAITKQIRLVVDASAERSSTRWSTRPLGTVQFYDYFELIHKKASDLDASDLQAVLVEELLRTVLKLVVFLESEFPLGLSTSAERRRSDESKYLCLANILTAVLAGFPERSAALFPNTASVPLPATSGFSQARTLFDEHAVDGRLPKAALKAALQVCVAT